MNIFDRYSIPINNVVSELHKALWCDSADSAHSTSPLGFAQEEKGFPLRSLFREFPTFIILTPRAANAYQSCSDTQSVLGVEKGFAFSRSLFLPAIIPFTPIFFNI
jgi:hypothetical protein